MLSRIADSLYWMNRYMERADGLLRATATHYILEMDKDVAGSNTWRPVLEVFSTLSPKQIGSIETNTEKALKSLLIDTANDNALRTIINKARENARGAQDHITKEVWEEMNGLFHFINTPQLEEQLSSFQALEAVKDLTQHTVMYAGIIDITMPRGTGWYFMSLGRYVERCLQTILLIQKELEVLHFSENDANDILQWRHLLLSLSGYELHLKSYHTQDHNYNVLHQVLINENFSRSVVYSLRRIDHYLNRLGGMQPATNDLVRTFGRLYASVKFMDLQSLNHLTVQSFLSEVKKGLLQFNTQLQQKFFSYA